MTVCASPTIAPASGLARTRHQSSVPLLVVFSQPEEVAALPLSTGPILRVRNKDTLSLQKPDIESLAGSRVSN